MFKKMDVTFIPVNLEKIIKDCLRKLSKLYIINNANLQNVFYSYNIDSLTLIKGNSLYIDIDKLLYLMRNNGIDVDSEIFHKYNYEIESQNEIDDLKFYEKYIVFLCILLSINIIEGNLYNKKSSEDDDNIWRKTLKVLNYIKLFSIVSKMNYFIELFERNIIIADSIGLDTEIIKLSWIFFTKKTKYICLNNEDIEMNTIIDIFNYITKEKSNYEDINSNQLYNSIKKWSDKNCLNLEEVLDTFCRFNDMGINPMKDQDVRKGCVDLHIHTTMSDGKYSSKDIVKAASFLGIKAISITDHATMEGIKEALYYSKVYGINLVPGIEISCCSKNQKVHILGYGDSLYCKEFQVELIRIREKWNSRFFDILEKLKEKYSIDIDKDEFVNRFNEKNMYSIEDLGLMLVEKGYSEDIKDSIRKFFNGKKESENSAYISSSSKYLYDAAEVIKIISKYGGIAVLAHPGKIGNIEEIKLLIENQLIPAGIHGVEAIHPTFSKEEQSIWKCYARIKNLLLFGGSDFHHIKHKNKSILGIGNSSERNVKVPYAYYSKGILGINSIPLLDGINNVNEMSIEEKVAVIMKPGFTWIINNNEEVEYINKFKSSSCRISKSKVNTIEKLIEKVQEIISISSIPTLINVNQEGGRLNTIDWKQCNMYAGNLALGNIQNDKLAFKIGYAMGKELRSLGITWNLAPVCDILDNNYNPSIGTRSFGNDEMVVAKHAAQFILGIQKAGVAATAKHFLGLGMSSVDSHEDIPQIDKIDSRVLLPFEYAIKSNVASIMLANIIIKEFDSNNPVLMSKVIINKILRDKLQYDGVIITENLSVPSLIKRYGSIGEVAVLAFEAGADILLFDSDFSKEKSSNEEMKKSNEQMLKNKIEIYNSLLKNVRSGRISIDRLNKSVERVVNMAKKYGISNWEEVNKQNYFKIYNDNIKLLEEVATASTNIKLNMNNILPLNIGKDEKILIIRSEYEKLTRADSSWNSKVFLYDYIKEYHYNTELFIVKEINDIDESVLKETKIVIFISYNAHLRSTDGKYDQVQLVNQLIEKNKKVIVVGTGDSFDIVEFKGIDAYISSLSVHQASMKIVSELIFNKIKS